MGLSGPIFLTKSRVHCSIVLFPEGGKPGDHISFAYPKYGTQVYHKLCESTIVASESEEITKKQLKDKIDRHTVEYLAGCARNWKGLKLKGLPVITSIKPMPCWKNRWPLCASLCSSDWLPRMFECEISLPYHFLRKCGHLRQRTWSRTSWRFGWPPQGPKPWCSGLVLPTYGPFKITNFLLVNNVGCSSTSTRDC